MVQRKERELLAVQGQETLFSVWSVLNGRRVYVHKEKRVYSL